LERKRSSIPPSNNAARLWRAGGLHSSRTAPPSLYGIAPIPDLWPRFPPSARSGWPDGLSLRRSSRRNTPRGPNSSRSRNLRCAAVSRGAVLSLSARGRRGGFAAHGATATGLCCGPRYAAIWSADAHHMTTSRGPSDEALRYSATPTEASRHRIQAEGHQIRNSKFEICTLRPEPCTPVDSRSRYRSRFCNVQRLLLPLQERSKCLEVEAYAVVDDRSQYSSQCASIVVLEGAGPDDGSRHRGCEKEGSGDHD